MKEETAIRAQVAAILTFIMLIPVVIAGIAIDRKNVVKAMEAKTDSQLSILEQNKVNFDLVFGQLLMNAKQFGLDKSMNELSENMAALGVVEKLRLIEKLNQLKLSNPFVTSISFLRGPSDPTPSYIDSELRYTMEPFDPEWKELFNRSDASLETIPVRPDKTKKDESPATTVVIRLPYESALKTSMIMMDMDIRLLARHIIGDDALARHSLIIGNNRGDVLFSSRNVKSGRPAQLDSMTMDKGFDRSERYGSGMIRFYSKLQSIDAYVVKLTDENELFKPERTMRKVVISVCVMFLLVCALSAYVLTGFLYRPVRKIMQSLKELIVGGEDVPTRTLDGADEIKRGVVRMLSENKSLRSTYHNIRPMMRDRYYYHILLGKYESYEEMLEQASLLQIDPHPGEYGLIVVEIDTPVFPSIQATHSAKLALLHLLEQFFVKPKNAIIIEIESDCWTVLYPVRDETDDKEFNKSAFAECKEMQDQAEQKWNVSVSFGIGKCGNGPGDMHHTFQSVRRLLKYKISLGSGLIMTLGDGELQLHATAEQRVVINEDKLQNMMQTGDFTQTEAYVRDLFEQMSRQSNIALVQTRMFELLHSILKAGEKIGIATEELFGPDRLLDEELYLLKSHEAALGWFLQIVREMCGFLRQQMVDQELRHIRSMVEYVSEHFSRIDLSLTLVSEQFKLSPTYISRVFKKETGYSFMDYINLLRLEKAKRLLLVSDAKIYEVALEAGFQTTHYFIRLFKTKFGVTPGDFRKYSVNATGE